MHFFGEAPERRPWIVEHDAAGRFLPGFLFALRFLAGEATHRFCYRAEMYRLWLSRLARAWVGTREVRNLNS